MSLIMWRMDGGMGRKHGGKRVPHAPATTLYSCLQNRLLAQSEFRSESGRNRFLLFYVRMLFFFKKWGFLTLSESWLVQVTIFFF